MQATEEKELTYQLVVRMGKRKYETELEYTMAQADRDKQDGVGVRQGCQRQQLEHPAA